MFEWMNESNTSEMIDNKETVKPEDGLILEHIGVKNIISDLLSENDAVFGNPESDDDHWHMQNDDYSCAVVCQEFIAEQLLDREFSEQEFSSFAAKKGWYDENSGTSLYDVGNILEELGLDVEKGTGFTLEDLAQELESDGKIICAVNTSIMHNPLYSQIPGLNADHAVQVIGIDYSDPNHPEVILNDPGVENGKGLRVDAQTFLKAWNTSNNFAAIARA